MPNTQLALPYHFDNTQSGRLILLALWGSLSVLLFTALAMETLVPLKPDEMMAVRVLITLFALADIMIGPYLFRQNKGARGTIDRHMVTVTADRFLGLQSAAPEGSFPLTTYRGIQIIRLKNSSVLDLVGTDKANTLRIRTSLGQDVPELAAFLQRELNLTLSG